MKEVQEFLNSIKIASNDSYEVNNLVKAITENYRFDVAAALYSALVNKKVHTAELPDHFDYKEIEKDKSGQLKKKLIQDLNKIPSDKFKKVYNSYLSGGGYTSSAQKKIASSTSEKILHEALSLNKETERKVIENYSMTYKNISNFLKDLGRIINLSVDTYKVSLNDHNQPEVFMKWSEPLDSMLIESIDNVFKVYKRLGAIINNPAHSIIEKTYLRVSFW